VEIAGSRILVTGASSGIGAALARQLAERGATVGIVARRRERLEQVLADCRRSSPRSSLWAADLGDLARAEAVVREAWDAFGHLDVLVNNAAIPNRTRVSRLTPQALDEVMRVNFSSPVRMGMVALERMLARGSGQIVNVSSLGGRLGIQYEAAYCAAKFALCGWSESMAIDLMDEPVDVKLVIPGPIDTEIWEIETEERNHYSGPKIPAADCAAGIVEAIEGEGFEYYIPDMRKIVLNKTEHTEAFLRGSAQMGKAQGT
jgi:short-subunit dehydrogenase